MADELHTLAERIRACTLCRQDLDRPPNPVFRVSRTARILVASQAPGNLADRSGKPFDDPSGRRLRDWMGVSDAEFYDPARVAIVPMGFCFPGYDKNGGDKPPIPRCAQTWRAPLLQALERVDLVLLIGQYAQKWHLGPSRKPSLTATVWDWREHLSEGLLPLPHPSWRNNGWLRKNPWFEADVLPELKAQVRRRL